VSRSPVAERLIAFLRPHTPFAEAIVRRQAERAGIDLSRMSESDLKVIGPMLVKAAAVFVDPIALTWLKREVAK
jgi:hypothetical protein